MSSIALPGVDPVNDLSLDVFSHAITQHNVLLGDQALSYPGKMGRVVVPLTLAGEPSLPSLITALQHFFEDENQGEVIPPPMLLASFGVKDVFIGVNVTITQHGVCGSAITADGTLVHYFNISNSWRLLLGSFESFDEVMPLALLVCVCLSHTTGKVESHTDVAPDEVALQPFSPRFYDLTQHVWEQTCVLSSIPITGPQQLPDTFVKPCQTHSDLDAEGWFGAPRTHEPLTLIEWAELYRITHDDEQLTWRRWIEGQTRKLASTLRLCGIAVTVTDGLPSGQSTSRIVCRTLDLTELAERVNASACGVLAVFNGNEASRGCKLRFPHHLPELIITSNGSFDSSPFPATCRLQAQLLQIVVTGNTRSLAIAAPAVGTSRTVNLSL